jgi:excisionase family DNA binding protein
VADVHIFQGDERQAGVLADLVHLHDVRMLALGGRLGIRQETDQVGGPGVCSKRAAPSFGAMRAIGAARIVPAARAACLTLASHFNRVTIEGGSRRPGRRRLGASLRPLLPTPPGEVRDMVNYFTLEEAAKLLHTTAEKVKEMARKGELRAFQDRGTLRFRAPEVVELARARGIGSDPELPMREAGPKSPPPSKRTADDEAPIGELPAKAPGRSPSPSPGRRHTSSKSPPPKASSDSDVRLVADGSDLDFHIAEEAKAASKSAPPSSGAGKKSGSGRSKVVDADSGVRMVPLEDSEDSDVKLRKDPSDSPVPVLGEGPGVKTPSDSDIRLHEVEPPADSPRSRKQGHVTEEIDLDAEAKRAEQAAKAKKPKTRHAPAGPLPTGSPFELSEHDVNVDAPKSPARKPSKSKLADQDVDSSSDFELTVKGEGSSPIELGSDEVKALTADDSDQVGLGELGAGKGKSGINIKDPADSGISLEQGGSDEIEFELSLDAGSTPKPGAADKEESSGEFELSLDDSSEETAAADDAEESSSEFELSLDVDDSSETENAEADSDSEFELTLDAEGEASGEHEKDIFETDFEVPALEEESGSEAVALEENDTDLESSDFDLALDEEGGEDAESGSQVVALEEGEEADEGAETVARPRKPKKKAAVAAEDEGELDMEIDAAAEEEEAAEPVVVEAKPARWGAMPAMVMLPTTVFLFFVGLLAFELVGTMWSYHKTGRATGMSLILKPLAESLDKDLPKD